MLQHAPEKIFYNNLLLFDTNVWTPIVCWQVICLSIYSDSKPDHKNFCRAIQKHPANTILCSVQVIGFITQILFWKLSALIKISMAHHFSTGNNSGILLAIEVSSAVLYYLLLCFLMAPGSFIFIVAIILNLSLTFLPKCEGIVIMITAICFYILLTALKVSNRSRILATGVLEIVLMPFFASPSFYAAFLYFL